MTTLAIIFHIIGLLIATGSLLAAWKGFFPKSTKTEIELLKKDIDYHKQGLERLEKKIDKINDLLMEERYE